MKKQAASLGEDHPTDVWAVVTTRRAAQPVTGDLQDEERPVVIVQAQGRFACRGACSRAVGGARPRGSSLTIELDAHTFDVLTRSLVASDLHTIGTPYRVPLR
jgi:mRNA-degrading endonuclease toxin of MazEF toxin-antitoxin module